MSDDSVQFGVGQVLEESRLLTEAVSKYDYFLAGLIAAVLTYQVQGWVPDVCHARTAAWLDGFAMVGLLGSLYGALKVLKVEASVRNALVAHIAALARAELAASEKREADLTASELEALDAVKDLGDVMNRKIFWTGVRDSGLVAGLVLSLLGRVATALPALP